MPRDLNHAQPGRALAAHAFRSSGLDGIAVRLPLLFLEEQAPCGVLPPPISHAAQCQGFVGVAPRLFARRPRGG